MALWFCVNQVGGSSGSGAGTPFVDTNDVSVDVTPTGGSRISEINVWMNGLQMVGIQTIWQTPSGTILGNVHGQSSGTQHTFSLPIGQRLVGVTGLYDPPTGFLSNIIRSTSYPVMVQLQLLAAVKAAARTIYFNFSYLGTMVNPPSWGSLAILQTLTLSGRSASKSGHHSTLACIGSRSPCS